MKVFNTETINYNDFKHEITQGSGVIVIKDVYSKEQISSAREVINNFAENQETKETHFNAEAEASGKIHLQQRVWNLWSEIQMDIH